MINPAPYLRQTIFALLNNEVSYNGSPVPVYENEGEDFRPVQIVIGEYSDADSSNKSNFGSIVTQVIQIVSEQPTAQRKVVDIIGEQVMQAIHSQPSDDNLSGSEFSICVVGKPSINHITEDGGAGVKFVRLILRYQLLIQNNN